MMNNNQSQKIVFLEEYDVIIFEIIKKYGIEETPAEAFEKIKEGKSPRKNIINRLVKDFFKNKILEKDLIFSLQKQLEVSEDMAKKIVIDIKEKLFPLIKVIEINKNENNNKEEENLIKSPIGVAEIMEKSTPIPEKEQKIKTALPPKKQERIKKPIVSEKTEKSMPQIKKSKGSDTYREPLE